MTRTGKPRTGGNKHRLEILYEDQWLSIICKPEGLLTVPYPGSREKTALDTLNEIRRKRGLVRGNRGTFAVHRLDKETRSSYDCTFKRSCRQNNDLGTMVKQRLYHALAENKRTMETLPESVL